MEMKIGQKTYSVGIYARLSVDSHDEKNDSIEVQIEIAKAYLEGQPDMALFGCYSDLGKSGTNFRRDGFQRLMEDVRLRRVNCIIVKDVSRFGRNYIETGNYIQKIFPFLGVRFIAVADHFDSLEAGEDELGMNLRNLANEMYARDIAVKVKSSRKAQWENGNFTGGIPPYGYRAEWRDGKKQLLVEETASDIVREMYRLYAEGKSMKALAAWLYEKKVHRPKDYHRYGHVFCEMGEELREWPRSSIKLLLTNPVYMGCLVQAKSHGKEKGYGIRTRQDLASGDWLVQENAHEAIVTPEQFFGVAERFGTQAQPKAMHAKEDIFAGLLFCGECGKKMGRTSHGKELRLGGSVKRYGYFCRNSSRLDGFSCERKYISCQALEQLVKTALRQEFALSSMQSESLVERNEKVAKEKRRALEQQLKTLQNKLEKQERKGSEQYLRYREGELGREAFVCWREETEKQGRKQKAELSEAMQRLPELDAMAAKQSQALLALLEFQSNVGLERELLLALLEKIYVFPDKRIEISFRFRKEDILEIS